MNARPKARTAFGAEQEVSRQAILATCDSIIDRCYRGILAPTDDRVTFARTVRQFLNKDAGAIVKMRDAIERMNKQQRGTSK